MSTISQCEAKLYSAKGQAIFCLVELAQKPEYFQNTKEHTVSDSGWFSLGNRAHS